MSLEYFKTIQENSERTTQGLRTAKNQFRYFDNGGFVKPNTLYSIYYTFNKGLIYLTGTSSTNRPREIIKVLEKDNYETYISLDSTTRQPYPKESNSNPTESDYRIGEITRYFTQKANDKTQPVFEVNKRTFINQNNLYRYTSFKWKISGLKQDVERENQITINRLIRDFPTITKKLFPLQLWTPPKDSIEDVENKLRRLKK